ncbi:MAG: aldo/keto reductase [candidate division Zixibacteria bacterium]|nr:aldo/keto reductase [candidate division Zixibacteria bacterium]
MNLSIDSKVKLNNGVEMPLFGLGVFRAESGSEARNAILWALEKGYRHIDTASMYGNEEDVGIAVKQSGIRRQDVFITTKLWNDDHGYDETLRAFDKSLKTLGLDYVDLYLIHWPLPEKRAKTWEAMERIYEEGGAKAIGVSNYTIRHLEELSGTENVIPAVNQVEFSPFLFQKELHDYCKNRSIQLEAYSSLTRGKKFDNPTLKSIAEKYSKTPAQILIRWTLEHRIVVIPKSANKDRINENANVFDFEIAREDMEKLDSLNEDFRVTWNPEEVA